ncbi:TetR/AcrR family transcriptional regulator [Bacillus marinisedimentorum]|uniref:TetR/AcrR family transcriptional regulator n=1 Tax=Bacillus marinisedimentorum TaxID=1821260 RepID=UPI0012FFBEB5|nr:TetR/AcrR family transcriptional regulator [Bacillus marinisedimentorum]
MNTAFMNLPEEKKNRIIQVCVEEFARHGYKNASTNTITSRADISKGILFHYFKNKKNLYLFVVEHSIDFIFGRIMKDTKSLEDDSVDFFENVKSFIIRKLEMAVLYPHEYQIIMTAVYQPPPSLKDELMQLIMSKRETMEPVNTQYIFQFLKDDMLVDGLPRDKAIEITMALFEYLGNKYGEFYKEHPDELTKKPDALLEDLDLYIHVLKHGIYKTPEK